MLLAALMTVATGLREARRVGKDGELPAHEIAGCDANPVCLPRLAAPLGAPCPARTRGSHYACAADDVWVQMKLRGAGEDIAASDSLLVVAGSDGDAAARCLDSSKCVAPNLQFSWEGPRPARGAGAGLTAAQTANASPRCARGDWWPVAPPPVRVAAHGSTAAFGAGGCVELWSLEEGATWTHVESLPTAIDLAGGRELVPWAFGTQVSLSEGVLAVSAGVRPGKSGPVVPAVAMYVTISPKEWVLAEVISCDTVVCRHTPQPCSATGAFPSPEESPTGCLGGGFGSALSLHGQMLTVGLPNNNTVVVYKQHSMGMTTSSSDVGIGLTWRLHTVLTAPAWLAANAVFGASLALSQSLLVVGAPATATQASGTALIFRLVEAGTGAATDGELLFDVGQDCCSSELPCCQTAYLGRAVTQMLQGDVTRVVIGDPANNGAVFVDCKVASREDADSHGSSGVSCSVAGYVQAPASASKTVRHDSARDETRGFGTSMAVADDVVFFGSPSWACSAAVGDKGGACGQVCHAAVCPPSSCLLYDFSSQTHICLSCGDDEETCKGGVEACDLHQLGVLPYLFIGGFMLMSLCCCLLAINIRLVLVTADIQPVGWMGTVLDLFCCIPRDPNADDEREEHLLDEEEGAGEGEDQVEDDNGDPVGKGYLPPAVSKALRAMADERRKRSPALGEEIGDGKAPRGAAGSRSVAAGGLDQSLDHGRHHEANADKRAHAQGSLGRGEKGISNVNELGGASASSLCGRTEEEEEEEEEELERGEEEEENQAIEHCEDPEDGDEKIGISVDYFCCKKCKERAIETVLVPCGHKALCKRCAHGLKACFICKAKVTRVQTVFHV